MKIMMLLLLGLFTFAIAINSQGLTVGSSVENFSLLDLDGKVQTLNRLKGSKGTVVVFLSAQARRRNVWTASSQNISP